MIPGRGAETAVLRFQLQLNPLRYCVSIGKAFLFNRLDNRAYQAVYSENFESLLYQYNALQLNLIIEHNH